MVTQADLKVKTLGPCTTRSPLRLSTVVGDDTPDFVTDKARIIYNAEVDEGDTFAPTLLFEKAGPREFLYFDPPSTRVGIVTCGGLCPGLNTVIRSMVLELYHLYGVREMVGFRYGYEGLAGPHQLEPLPLTPATVRSIHKEGGSVLGLSRGKQDAAAMVDTLVRERINILFGIGGDGTLRGLHSIYEEVTRRGLPIAVVGVPKTVDNDVAFVDKTFGFDTAVEAAREAIACAHVEALGARLGIGIVKLMGRDSGFIAASATLASGDVNFCLVPEVRFDLEGPRGLLSEIEKRLLSRGHAVVVVAEGCGASLVGSDAERDASGNLRYASAALDVGPRLRDSVSEYFQGKKIPITVKYIDPSYMIRSVAENSSDTIFCDGLARQAVHAGMAGKTDIVIGRWHRLFTHVPLGAATSTRKRIDPEGSLWLAVTETTGQTSLRNDGSGLAHRG